MNYIDAYLVPVISENKAKYKELAETYAKIAIEHGALRVVENWQDDVPIGKHTDFYKSVDTQEGESVVFSWVEWASKEAREAGNAKIHNDPRLKMDCENIFDGKRMIYGGFANLIDFKG